MTREDRPRRWADEEIVTLRRMAEGGYGARAISLAIGRPVDAVQAKARKESVTLPRADSRSAARHRIGLVAS